MPKASKPKPKELAEVKRSPFEHIQHLKKRAYLAAYANSGNIVKACKLSKIDRSTQWLWTVEDEEFAAAQLVARRMACDLIEAEIERRAIEGTLKPVFQGGQEVGVIREFSDTLLIFLAKGAMPHKYRENQSIEHSGPNGAPIETKITLEVVPSTSAED